MRLLHTIASAGLILWASIGHAANEPETIGATRHTSEGQAVELRTHAHWDGNCKSITDPTVIWVAEPAHGKVTQTGDTVMGHAPAVGRTNCEGIPMHGLRLTYQPEPGFKGTDRLTYDVRYSATDPLVRYRFKVVVE